MLLIMQTSIIGNQQMMVMEVALAVVVEMVLVLETVLVVEKQP